MLAHSLNGISRNDSQPIYNRAITDCIDMKIVANQAAKRPVIAAPVKNIYHTLEFGSYQTVIKHLPLKNGEALHVKADPCPKNCPSDISSSTIGSPTKNKSVK